MKANVVFFTKGSPTERVWIYDARTNVPGITKKDRPLTAEHFAGFVKCYGSDPNGRAKRKASDSKDDRWRSFPISEVKERGFKLDGFKWLKEESLDDPDDLPEPEDLAAEAIAELEQAIGELNEVLRLLREGDGNTPEPKANRSVREILKRFRQSVLAAACSGRLTEKWRKRNAPAGLSADAVLAARRRAWVRAEAIRRAREGRSVGDAELVKRFVAPVEPDAPREAPESWLWTTLDQITLLSGGLTKGQKRSAHASLRRVPYLRVANVQRGHLDLSVIKEIEATDAEIAELQLRSGDILLNEGGDIDKLGRGWVWEGQIAICIHQNHVFRARPLAELVNPYFVSHYANAIGQDFFFSAGAQTVNLASVSLSKVRTLPVPLPPPAEQAEIVRRVGALLAHADAVEARVGTAVMHSDSASRALLD